MKGSGLLTLRASMAILVLFTLATGCGKNLESAVATVGDEVISLDDLRQEMTRQYRSESEAARKDLAQREKALEMLIERRLKVAGARAEGFFDKEDVKAKEASLLSDGMINKLYEKKILDEVVSEAMLKETYEKQATEVKAAHILLRWNPDSASVRQRAQEIAREIRNGLAFDQAAAQYTEEPSGKERMGDLGWFTWGRMVGAFQETCWTMKEGEVSAPVETQFGVHLIQLNGRRTVENRPSYEDQLESLKDMCRRAMGEQIMAAGNGYLESMKTDLGYKLESARMTQLLTDIQANMSEGRKLQEILKSLDEGAWKGQALATWKGGKLEMADLTKSLERNFRPAESLTTVKDLEDLVNNAAIMPMLSIRARAENMDKDKDLLKSVKEQLENSVVMTYERERIKGEIKIPDEQITAWYQAHPADYMHPQMVRVQEVYVLDKNLADQLAARAKKGENFGKLAKQYTERPDRKGTDGTLEPFQAGRYGKMGEQAFAMKVGEVSEALPVGRNWSVIKLLEQIPPSPKTLKDSETSIRMKLEREERTKRLDTWRKEMEAKIPVVRFKEKLSTLFADVEDKTGKDGVTKDVQ